MHQCNYSSRNAEVINLLAVDLSFYNVNVCTYYVAYINSLASWQSCITMALPDPGVSANCPYHATSNLASSHDYVFVLVTLLVS